MQVGFSPNISSDPNPSLLCCACSEHGSRAGAAPGAAAGRSQQREGESEGCSFRRGKNGHWMPAIIFF